MGKIAIVDGLEMFGIDHVPGSAVCDNCGCEERWKKRNYREFSERTDGWWFSGHLSGSDALCPDCAPRRQ